MEIIGAYLSWFESIICLLALATIPFVCSSPPRLFFAYLGIPREDITWHMNWILLLLKRETVVRQGGKEKVAHTLYQ